MRERRCYQASIIWSLCLFFSHFCTLDCLHNTYTSKRLETFLADRLRLGIDKMGVAHDMLMFLVDADIVGPYTHQVCCYVEYKGSNSNQATGHGNGNGNGDVYLKKITGKSE